MIKAKSKAREFLEKLSRENLDVKDRALARKAYGTHPHFWPNEDACSTMLRVIRGHAGKSARSYADPSSATLPSPEITDEQQDRTEIRESRDDCAINYIGRKISTPEELLQASKIDLKIWEIESVTVNTWEVAGKKKNGQDDDKRWKADTLWQVPLLQIKIKLRRKAPKPIQTGVQELLKELRTSPVKLPPVARKKQSNPHLLELSLYDAHFGKKCWGQQTGTNYDLEIARDDYVHAVDDLLAKVQGFDIDKICLPIGHDFYQVNNWLGTTAKGTVVDAVDDRFQKVFRVGCRAVEYAIRRCREVAQVEVLWVPGNHDPETSWYMVEWLAAVFAADKHVTVDAGPLDRKYRMYGNSLIGYAHGDGLALDKLPIIMATDPALRDWWGKSRYRFFRVGHFHKKKETKYTGADTFNGVSVTILPSLSGTDRWHYEKGYVNNHRMAESALWSLEGGLTGTFSVEAKSAK